MGKNIFVIILILSIFTISCEKLPNAPENDSAIIVQAYLYANEPISDIRITTLGEDKGFNSHTLPVIDANVSLIKKGMNYQLTPSATDSGYYFYSGSDLIVEPGDTFRIEVVFREICASGQTVVPNIPKITKVSADTFFLHKRSSKQRDKEFMIEWSGVTDGNNFYFAKMDYIYGEPGDILSHQPLKIVPFYISSPQQQNQSKWLFNEYSFRDKNIFLINKDSYLSKIREGWYCFYINQVTQDFIDLYETKFNYWGEPDKIYSNIVNGFGIFTAFGVDSTFFYTKQIY